MRTDKIFLAPVRLALMVKLENGDKTPLKSRPIHALVPVYQCRDYYLNIKTKVKYRKYKDCDVNELYVVEDRMISFYDEMGKVEEIDQEDYYVPKYISKRRVLSLFREQ